MLLLGLIHPALKGRYVTDIPDVMPGAIMSVIPIIVLFVIF